MVYIALFRQRIVATSSCLPKESSCGQLYEMVSILQALNSWCSAINMCNCKYWIFNPETRIEVLTTSTVGLVRETSVCETLVEGTSMT